MVNKPRFFKMLRKFFGASHRYIPVWIRRIWMKPRMGNRDRLVFALFLLVNGMHPDAVYAVIDDFPINNRKWVYQHKQLINDIIKGKRDFKSYHVDTRDFMSVYLDARLIANTEAFAFLN